MIKFYYHPSPNPAKVALFLEEAGLPYEMVPVDTRKGDQFKPEFLAINPNAKTPALTDGEATIFDSNAILLYLAEKTGQFLPEDTAAARGQMLSWLMFVATGIGPYCGQAVHFSRFAPEKIPYAINRYAREAERHWGIIEAHLAKHRYMLGDSYTLVDMSVWGWATRLGFALGEEGLRQARQRQAPFRRDLGPAGGAARRGAEGPVRLQDGVRRGGAQVPVPAERPSRPGLDLVGPARPAPASAPRSRNRSGRASPPASWLICISNALSKIPVAVVAGLCREIELRRQHGSAAGPDLDVEMARPAGIDAGNPRDELVAALAVGELVPAEAEAGIVISPGAVGVPEIDQGSGDRAAARRQDEARQRQELARTVSAQIALQGRGGREEGAFGLRFRRAGRRAAGRRQRQSGLLSQADMRQGEGGKARRGQARCDEVAPADHGLGSRPARSRRSGFAEERVAYACRVLLL